MIGAARDVQAAAVRAGSDATEPQVRSLVRHARDEVDIVSAALARMRSVGPAALSAGAGGHGPPAAPAKLIGCRPPPRRRAGAAPARPRPRPRRRPAKASLLGDGFAVGVATSGYQVEGGFNGDGEPHNNWSAWEGTGRAARSGLACDFWRHPEEALDRAAAIGCNAFRLSVEWARLEPEPGRLRRRRARALRRDPLHVRGAGPGAHRHAAPLHPPVVARRGVLAAARLARRLRPPRGAGRAGAGAVLPALGDHQRAQHRDAHGLDRGRRARRAGAWPSPTPSARSTTS